MLLAILHRAIFWETGKLFGLALTTVTLLFLPASLLELLQFHELTALQTLSLLPLLICVMVPRTVPAACLFACCVLYGRMAQDQEVLALRASGCRAVWLLWPGVLLGTFLSFAVLAFSFTLLPPLQHRLESLVLDAALDNFESSTHSLLARGGYLSLPESGHTVTVRGTRRGVLLDPLIQHVEPNGQTDLVVRAEQATIAVDRERGLLVFHLSSGIAHLQSGAIVSAAKHSVEVPLPHCLRKGSPRYLQCLNWSELLQQRRSARKRESMLTESPGDRSPAAVQRRRNRLSARIKAIDVQLWGRPAESLACLCLVLVGSPLAICFGSGNYLQTCLAVVLPIVVVFYPVQYTTYLLAWHGWDPVPLLVWSSNVVLMAAALVLLWRLP